MLVSEGFCVCQHALSRLELDKSNWRSMRQCNGVLALPFFQGLQRSYPPNFGGHSRIHHCHLVQNASLHFHQTLHWTVSWHLHLHFCLWNCHDDMWSDSSSKWKMQLILDIADVKVVHLFCQILEFIVENCLDRFLAHQSVLGSCICLSCIQLTWTISIRFPC